MKTVRFLFTMLLTVVFLCGCGSSKDVPEGHYLLDHVTIKSDSKDLDVTSLEQYVRQKGKSTLPNLIKKNKSIVIFDSVQTALTIQDLRSAMHNQGYMHADADYTTKIKGKKIKVTYNLHPGSLYYIDTVNYNIQDDVIRQVLNNYREEHKKDRDQHYLRPGTSFSVSALENERKRITDILLDSGFYKFHKDFIQFNADSASNNNGIDITLNLLPYRLNSESAEMPHPRYKINEVSFLGSNGEAPHIRKRFLSNATALKPGKFYSYNDLQTTYQNFGRMSAVKYTNIQFSEIPDTTLLNCAIQLDTSRPSTISFQPEGTNTAGDLGAAASLTYQNRNIFKGSELFSLQLRGAFEAITGLEGYRDENFVEWSAETKLQFPRFIAPFVSKNYKRRSSATSELSLSWDLQNRPEFHRRVFSAAWRYRWTTPDKKLSYRIDVPDINYVNMPWISETFKHDYLDSVSNRNAILRYNYEDLFIIRLGFGMTYNNGVNALRLNFETAGNLINGIASWSGFHKNNNGQHTLFGIAYAQYAKFDFAYTRHIFFNEHNSIALHGDFGIAYPYGNSNILPFEKRYFAGGANSIRGWSVRELGPGSYRGKDGRIDFINQTGDLKLNLNAEYRMFLFWKFDGAVFVDAGNIWTLRNYPDQPGGQFKFSEFYKQIAVAYGLGLRLNFNYFILRFDFGMKAINPAYETQQEHYAIFHPDLSRDFTFHFAVGLPF